MANIKDSKPYDIMIGTDNRPGGVEGEYHVQFKSDIMNVTFCEQEEVAKEFGGTMRVSADGQEWADFYHEADAVKFAEKVVGMNQERDLVGRYQTAGMGNDTKFWPDRGTLGIYQAFAFKNNNILIFKDVDDSEGIRLSSLSHEEQKHIIDSIGSLLDRHIVTQQENHTNKNLSKEMLAEKIKTSDYWTDVEENNYPDKVIFNNNEGRLANGEKVLCFDCEWEEIGDLHIVSFSNPIKRNLFVTEDGYLVNSKVHTSTVKPAYLTFKKTDIKVFDTTIRQDQQQGLSEAKAQLMHVIESARADLGDTIKIHPTTIKLAGVDTTVKAIFLAHDGKGGGEFRLAGEDYAVLAIGEGDRTEFNIEKILKDTASITALTDAVRVVLNHRPRIKTRQDIPESDIRSAEYAAKQVVHDRIVTPSARRFTPEQIDTLKHYRAMFSADTDTRELYTRLYEEAIKDADVARKPEKWQTDTLRELNDLAEGITREETRGLHK